MWGILPHSCSVGTEQIQGCCEVELETDTKKFEISHRKEKCSHSEHAGKDIEMTSGLRWDQNSDRTGAVKLFTKLWSQNGCEFKNLIETWDAK